MGASCATGSKTTDPDKEPYRSSSSSSSSSEKKKKGKGREPVEQESENRKSVKDTVSVKPDRERRPAPPPQENEDPDGKRKSSEASRLRATNEDDAPLHRSSKGSSTEVTPSRPHPQSSEKKRDSREVRDDPQHGKAPAPEEHPRPKKRTPKDDKQTVEGPSHAGEKHPEPAPRTRHDGGAGKTRRQSAEKRTQEVDETGKQLEADKRERKRSSLDNEFIVPVKVEAKEREASPQERFKKTAEVLTRSPDQNLEKPDLVRDSFVGFKSEPKRRSTENEARKQLEKQEPQKSPFSIEVPVPSGVRDEERVRSQIQSDGSRKSKEIKVEDIKVEAKPGYTSALLQTSEPDNAMQVPLDVTSPYKRPDKFEIPSSGLTTKTTNDAAVPPSLLTFSSSRSPTRETDEKRKSGPRQIPSPTKQPGEETMAIFGALRGLKVQKPGPDVIPTTSTDTKEGVAPSPVERNLPASASSQLAEKPHSTKSSTVFPDAVENSTNSSPATDVIQQSPPKPIPVKRTTIAQNKSAPTDASNISEGGKISPNGIDSLNNENDLKSKPDRSSKLPVKGSITSPITSPSISTSDSINLSPVSPNPSSLSPLSSKISLDSSQHKDPKFASGTDEIEATKKLLVNLSEENKNLINSHVFCQNTRTRLLQTIDKWFTGTDKDKENTSRVMAISGRPGIGKTCLSTELCRRYSSQLVGDHFFCFQPRRLRQNFAQTMVLSIAARMIEVIPGYSDFLPTSKDLRQLLDEDELLNIFNALVTRPLQNLNTDKRFLMIVDALDECHRFDRDSLLQLVNGFDKRTPECVYLFCTVRDDNQLTGQLERVQMIELKGTSDTMTSDIKRFLRDPMSRLIDRISLDGALTELSTHSQGTFLAAYLLKRKLDGYPDATRLALRDVTLFSSGLGEIIKEYFQRFHDHLSKKFSAKEANTVYSGVVAILALAKDKLNPAFVKQVHDGLDPELDLQPLRGILDTDESGCVGVHHSVISEWMLSEQVAAGLAVAPGNARQRMSDALLVWLNPILELSTSKPSTSVPTELQNYALKHALEHLTDAPKNQDNIAGLLCSLVFIENKLQIPGVTVEDLLNDYKHRHYQMTGTSSKLITLEDYMMRFAELAQQIEAYSVFVRRRSDQLSSYPTLLLQFAANYPTFPRIQQNAQNELLEKSWLEDVTATAESPSTTRQVTGIICQSDLSNDNKNIAILTHDEQTVLLYLLNAATGEYNGDPIDISGITDRKGLCLRFMPDNTHLFVGSLSTFVTLKTRKPITSTLDSQALQLKENFAIECCDAIGNTLACGISTLPWNGRMLYIGVYDLKTKKAKVIEVHSFRFGGSSQFGIKALALSQDAGLICTCVKQQKKVEMNVVIWNTATSKQLYTVDLENDALTRCYFVGSQSLLISGGRRTPEELQHTYCWSFQDKKARLLPNGTVDNASVAFAKGSHFTMMQRYQKSSQFIVSRYKAGKHENPDDRYILCGLEKLSDLIATDKSVIFLSRRSVLIFNFADLTVEETRPAAGSFALYNSIVESIGFFSRSDDPVVVHRSSTAPDDEDGLTGTVSVSRVSVKNDGTLLGVELFAPQKLESRTKKDKTGELRCFQGEQTTSNIWSCTSDGVVAILNTGSSVNILDVASGTRRSLPTFAEISKELGSAERTSSSRISCVISPKEPLAGISYPEKPDSVYLFDVRSKTLEPCIEIKFDPKTPVTDFAFIPNNGNLISYHRVPEQSIFVWNQRNGASVSKQTGVDVVYVRQSLSSDRLVMSLRPTNENSTGSLVLRNSDNRFNVSLTLPQRLTWNHEVGCGDVEFSGDGTVLVGLFSEAKVVRAWNIGNGEVLKDIEFCSICSTSELVGMLTNIHVIVSDGWTLHVIDVDSGDVISAHHSADRFSGKSSRRGLRLSPKGGLIAGSTLRGAELRLFQCHGLAPVKRKTTLQIIRNR